MEEVPAMKHSQAAQDYMDGIDDLLRVRSKDGDEEPVMNRLDDLWFKMSDADLDVVREYTRNAARE